MTYRPWMKHGWALIATGAVAFSNGCGGAKIGLENGDAGDDSGGAGTAPEGGSVSPGQPGPGGPGNPGGGMVCPPGSAHPNECCSSGGCRSSASSPFTPCKPGETSVAIASECCEVGVANPACSGSGGGTPSDDASAPPSGDDGGIGPTTRACWGSRTSCQCEETQVGHDYLVWCNNTSCVCSVDGNTTKTLPSSQSCGGGPGGLDAAWGDCGFPP